jgi:heme/copper-type cytochrome/quinol oxidase subunit 2
MASITLEHVWDALLIMLLMAAVAISVVAALMYGLYRFFKNTSDEPKD